MATLHEPSHRQNLERTRRYWGNSSCTSVSMLSTLVSLLSGGTVVGDHLFAVPLAPKCGPGVAIHS